MPQEKANLGTIFGQALFGVAEDLVEAKEKGQQLPGLLDKIADIGMKAKQQGIDIVQAEAADRVKKMIPWVIAGVAVGILVVVVVKKSS